MSYAEDVERLRDYVRTAGRDDYRRMREVGSELIQVEFIANADGHAAAISQLLDDPGHVRVIEGNTSADRAERAQRYWEPIREQLADHADTNEAITALGFGNDEDGPLLLVGIYPFTAETAARAAEIFAPHRVQVNERPPVTPVTSQRSEL